ncbi:MAG TPA: metallophosphoesterase [Chryseolinea sp.]|nr:metallophosphoesterase [Chryseolinea sp.]
MAPLNRRNFIRGTAASAAAFSVPGLIRAQAKSNRALRIVQISDVHLDTREIAGKNFIRVLTDINAMKDKPDLIINTGDSVFRSDGMTFEDAEKQWNLLARLLKENNRIPIRSCIGNHDVWFGPDAKTDESYKTHKHYHKNWVLEVLALPDRYHSSEMNGWQFIALDSINLDEYSIDKGQFSWLEKELDRIPPKRPICIFSHVSILSVIPLMRGLKEEKLEDIRYPASRQHRDALQLKNLFYKHPNVKLCLSGHTHQIDQVNFIGVQYFTGGTVSGNWWGDHRDSVIFEEFPPAYTLIDLFADGMVSYETIFYPFTT